MESKQLKYSIIIPNWNGIKLLEKNLPSVLKAVGDAEIIVVDDSSTDDSVAFIKKNYPTITLIEKNSNSGFSSTVNKGVNKAAGEIVILLNTDIKPSIDFIKPLHMHFTDPEVFAVGCLEKSKEAGGEVLRGRGEASFQHGFYIHRRGEVNKSTTAWVSGGSGAFRKSIWTKLGGLDELFDPYYWEDIDLSYRALKSGYKIVFEPLSMVEHRHDEGVIKTNSSQNQISTIAYRNQFIFIWKNITDPSYLIIHFINLPKILLKSIFQRDLMLFKGIILAIKLLPKILSKRSQSKKHFILSDSKIISNIFR